jgi:hypothetical protein
MYLLYGFCILFGHLKQWRRKHGMTSHKENTCFRQQPNQRQKTWFAFGFFFPPPLPVCFCFALLTRLLSLKKGHNPTYSIKLLVQSVVAVPRDRSLGSLSCNPKARNWSQFPLTMSRGRRRRSWRRRWRRKHSMGLMKFIQHPSIHPSSLLQMTIWLSSIQMFSYIFV